MKYRVQVRREQLGWITVYADSSELASESALEEADDHGWDEVSSYSVVDVEEKR
jgi:hypothetical protein